MKKCLFKVCVNLSFCSLLLLLSGCGKKTLSCNKVTDYTDMKTDHTVTLYFKGDSLVRYKFKANVILSGEKASLGEEMMGYDVNFKNLKPEKAVSFSTEKSDDGFIFKADVNVSKLDQNSKENVPLINYNNSFDEIKSDLEDNGYICN